MIRLCLIAAFLAAGSSASALELTRTAPKTLSPKPVAPVTGVVCDKDTNEI